jgi:hypothetical protein
MGGYPGAATAALNTFGTAARNARLSARQLEDFAHRFTCKETWTLRGEAAKLELSLDRYLFEIIRHRRAALDLIRETVAAERPERVEV